jgi:hypothetical protein
MARSDVWANWFMDVLDAQFVLLILSNHTNARRDIKYPITALCASKKFEPLVSIQILVPGVADHFLSAILDEIM